MKFDVSVSLVEDAASACHVDDAMTEEDDGSNKKCER